MGASRKEVEPLLGTSDIQSLADLGHSYEMIRDMKVVPFSVQSILRIAVIMALPVLPVLPLAIPLKDILDILGRALM